MAITVEAFRARFPELADPPYTNAIVQLRLDDAMLIVDEARWGRLYELGVYYLAAHEAYLGNQQAKTAGGGGGSLGAGGFRSACPSVSLRQRMPGG